MILLDTHAWVWWWDDPSQLSGPAAGALAAADEVLVSAMSVWEVAMLAERGRMTPRQGAADWIRNALRSPNTRLVDVDLDVAISAVGFTSHLRDPADALIAATAQAFQVPVVTKDPTMQAVPGVVAIW